jgi:23S rRNA (adenine2030-N6)-methyltransferase
MNYRHAYHAGNHADVLKHIILSRVLAYMVQKDKPLAALDAHAGIGTYDLKGLEAFKTGEWKSGIGKLLAGTPPTDVAALLAPYTRAISAINPTSELHYYPGSPDILRHMMRPADRIILNELHPIDAETLASRMVPDSRVRVTNVDAAVAVKANLPFPEKRGIVLIDPAFEVDDEFDRISRMLKHAFQRMANVVLLMWYPLKSSQDASRFHALCAAHDIPGTLAVDLLVKEPFAEGGLAGSGMAVFNPPFTLKDEAERIMPYLAQCLGLGTWGRGSVKVLTPPR